MGYERGRRPHFKLIMNDKDSATSGEIGAAWRSEDSNSIYIKFNPFVHIPIGGNYSVTMYPVDEDGESITSSSEYSAAEIEKWRQFYFDGDSGDDDVMTRVRRIPQRRKKLRPSRRTKKR